MLFDSDPEDGGRRYRGAPDPPATYLEHFSAAERKQHDLSSANAKAVVLEEEMDKVGDEITKATGKEFINPYRYSGPALDEMSGTTDGGAALNPLAARYAKRSARRYVDPQKYYYQQIDELSAAYPDALDWTAIRDLPYQKFAERARVAKSEVERVSQSANLVAPEQVPLIGRIPLVGDAAAGLYNIATSPGVMASQMAGALYGMRESPLDIGSNVVGGVAGARAFSIVRNAITNGLVNMGTSFALEPFVGENYKAAGIDRPWSEVWADAAGAFGTGFALDAGIRGPGRAIAKISGQPGPYGGVFRSAEEPAPRPTITPEVAERAKNFEPEALREVAKTLGVDDDPALQGALNHLETTARVDAEAARAAQVLGTDNVRSMEQFERMARAAIDPDEAPVIRAPDPQPEIRAKADPDAAIELMGRYPGELERLMTLAEERLGTADPRLPQMLADAFEAGLPDLLPHIREAVERMGEGKSERLAFRDFAAAVAKIAEDPTFALRTALHTGRASPLEVARMLREQPGVVAAHGLPETSGMAQAQALAALDEAAFEMVSRGEARPDVAREVSDRVPSGQQADLLRKLTDAGVDGDTASRMIRDLLPPTGADTRTILGVEQPGSVLPDPRVAEKIDTPTGKGAKVQAERLAAELAPEIAEARAMNAAGGPEIKTLDQALDVRAQVMDAFDAAMGRKQVDEMAARILPEGVNVVHVDTPMVDPVTGRLLDAISDTATGDIQLATAALNPKARLGHEAVHTLVTRGLLSPDEIATLAQRAGELGVFPDALRESYRTAYAERVDSAGVPLNDAAKVERMLREEAAAHVIEAAVKGKPLDPVPTTIVQKVVNFLRRLALELGLRNVRTPDEIASAILSGDVAKRKAVQAWMRENDITALAVWPGAQDAMMAMGDVTTGQSMRRDLDALGYYSQALEAAKALKQAKGTPEQMLAQLKAAGVKQAEMEATGLDKFLAGKKSVTRDEIVGHLEGNRVGLREVQNLKSPNAEVEARPNPEDASTTDLFVDGELAGQVYRDGARLRVDLEGGRSAQVDTVDQALQYVRARDPALKDQTKWSNYSLDPSNPTYRETVLHLPDNRQGVERRRAAAEARMAELDALDGNLTAEQRQEYARLRNGEVDRENFRSGHFSEPNIVGHLMTSLVKHEGRPVYLIDQIQSDWGQKLRDGGVRDEAKIAELKARSEAADAAYNDMPRQRRELRNEVADALGLHSLIYEAPTDAAFRKMSGDERLAPELRQRITDHFVATEQARDRRTMASAELKTAEAMTTGHPLVNTTDQWTNTTLRRAIRQAAEADADYIAIPHGDTVLSYNPGDEAGMRGFYGSRTSEGIVPKNLRKLLEKLDKDSAKPQVVATLETPTKGAAGKGFTLFPLTDAVKAKVKGEGQVMFAFAGENARTADKAKLAEAQQMEAAGKDRTAIWKATGWFRGVDQKWRFEIDDSGATATFGEGRGFGPNSPLNHPGISQAYPDARPLIRAENVDTESGSWMRAVPAPLLARVFGYGLPETITAKARNSYWLKSEALHEGQHAIQAREGFAPGASQHEPNYAQHAGEVEARTVQRRMNYTPEQRSSRPPWEDYDVPESEQIVRFANGTDASGQAMFAMGDRERGIPSQAVALHSFTSDADIKAHADYKAAKAGDPASAVRLVSDLVSPEMVERARSAFGSDAIYVPVAAEERLGRNKIPDALAHYYADSTGASIDDGIVQTSRAFHTGARPLDRLLGRPMFDGPVEAGRRYVIVDDVSVMGGTFAELANHIQQGGGEVAGVVSLVNASRTGVYAASAAQIAKVEARYGDLIRKELGIAPSGLTADEAAYILNFRDADALGSSLAKARAEREQRLLSQGVRPSEAKDRLGGGDPSDPMFAMGDEPQPRQPLDLPSLAARLSNAITPYVEASRAAQMAELMGSVERDADGNITSLVRDGKKYTISRGADGSITGLTETDAPTPPPVSFDIERGPDGLAARIQANGQDYVITRDSFGQIGDVTQGIIPRLAEQQQQATQAAAGIVDQIAASYGVTLPEGRSTAIATEAIGIAQAAPADPVAALNALTDLVNRVSDEMAQEAPPARAANDNIPTPLQQDLADMDRMTSAIEFVGVCRL